MWRVVAAAAWYKMHDDDDAMMHTTSRLSNCMREGGWSFLNSQPSTSASLYRFISDGSLKCRSQTCRDYRIRDRMIITFVLDLQLMEIPQMIDPPIPSTCDTDTRAVFDLKMRGLSADCISSCSVELLFRGNLSRFLPQETL